MRQATPILFKPVDRPSRASSGQKTDLASLCQASRQALPLHAQPKDMPGQAVSLLSQRLTGPLPAAPRHSTGQTLLSRFAPVHETGQVAPSPIQTTSQICLVLTAPCRTTCRFYLCHFGPNDKPHRTLSGRKTYRAFPRLTLPNDRSHHPLSDPFSPRDYPSCSAHGRTLPTISQPLLRGNQNDQRPRQ